MCAHPGNGRIKKEVPGRRFGYIKAIDFIIPAAGYRVTANSAFSEEIGRLANALVRQRFHGNNR